jgi:hypothetical protein
MTKGKELMLSYVVLSQEYLSLHSDPMSRDFTLVIFTKHLKHFGEVQVFTLASNFLTTTLHTLCKLF